MRSEYCKPPLSVCQQVERLAREYGLSASDREDAERALRAVGYTRLSAYWKDFIDPKSGRFYAGIEFPLIWRRYAFDRHLRLLLMDAIERVEISMRSSSATLFALRHGPFGHLDIESFRVSKHPERLRWHDYMCRSLREEIQRSKEPFVRKFFEIYPRHEATNELPIWLGAELMSFGCLVSFIKNQRSDTLKLLAYEYGLPAKVLVSWLHTLNDIRNLCAHHARVWNRVLVRKPTFPKRDIAWQMMRRPAANERIFSVLIGLSYMLKTIAPQSRWGNRLKALLAEYPDVPLRNMGFPDEWQTLPFFQNCNGVSK
jgi:abortive infection bacteriophage resistance protein